MEADLFMEILRSELNQTELDSSVKNLLTEHELSALYRLSKRHDLTHILSACLYKNDLLTNEELLTKFSKKEVTAVYRSERLKYAYDEVCGILEQQAITYIPLKGLVLRQYYPTEGMRTCCDMDILIQEKDLDRAVRALTRKGYVYREKAYHDVTLIAPNGVRLELHFNICENQKELDAVLQNVWSYVIPEQGSRCRFTDEFFLFHIFAHISFHFLHGGCGVRSLTDIWVMGHKMGLTCEYAKDLLKQAGIYQFADEITSLAEACFSGKPKNSFTDTMLLYILNGGAYGSLQNSVAMGKKKTNSALGYALKRLFLPYRSMTLQFPVLKKLPVLLPACWLLRMGKMLLGGKLGRSMTELKTAKNVTDQDVEVIQQMRSRLGL